MGGKHATNMTSSRWWTESCFLLLILYLGARQSDWWIPAQRLSSSDEQLGRTWWLFQHLLSSSKHSLVPILIDSLHADVSHFGMLVMSSWWLKNQRASLIQKFHFSGLLLCQFSLHIASVQFGEACVKTVSAFSPRPGAVELP